MKKQIALLFGGMSSEHEVSCKSVVNVISGLNPDKYEIHRIGITKEGKWLYVDNTEQIKNDSWRQNKTIAVISPDRSQSGILKIYGTEMKLIHIDVVFPVLHGLYGEDGTVQGLLKLSGIPYVGCGVLCSAVSMDKISTKLFVDQLGVCQANYVVDIAKDCSEADKTADEVEKKLGYPVFVKPSNAGSSQGVSKAHNRQELLDAIKLAKKHDTRVLIEENINGREIECAVLGGGNVKASRVGEILAAADFYDFDAKYNSAESKTVVDPDLSDAVKENVRKDAVSIFKAVSGFGLSRVDFFVEKETNRVVFNEINTLPGFTNISMYPMLWEDMGVGREELVDQLIELAYER